jgi:HK97 family phage major capsid protein
MAIETISAIIDGISGDSVTRELIARRAVDQSVLNQLAPGRRLTSPVVRGAWAGEAEALAVDEGNTKTVTSGLMNTVSYQTKAIAIAVPVSNLVYESEDDLVQGLISQLTAGVARGIDRTILRNTESVFTTGVTQAAISAGNVITVASGSAFSYQNISDMFGLVEADGYSPNGVIVREAAKGQLRMSETDSGMRYFVAASQAEPATIFGAPAGFVKSNGTLPVLPATGAASETIMVAGDWGQVHWGYFGDVQIKANPYAQDYFLKNQTLVLVEMYVGFGILDANAFAVLRESA